MNDAFITPRRVALALALLLVLAFIGPITGATTFFYRDYGVLAYPTAAYHKEMFWRGEVPLWNPYSNLGVPFLAQWGTMTLYPFSLFYLLLPLPWSLNFFCLAHLWFGALGVFYLARRWTNSNAGAALASVLFLFNGLTLSTLAWPNYTVAFAWMPWTILAAELAWQNGRRSIPLAALCGAMQMFSGVPEIILLTWGLITALWIAAKFRQPLAVASVILLIAGLCAIQLLPFFELLSHSHRQTGASAAKWALPFTALPNFALPMLHTFQSHQGTWHQYDQLFLSSIYLGLPAILLAIVGAIVGGTRARLLAAAALLCILLALGPNLPTYSLLEKLPIIGLARYPVKFSLLLALLIPLLAAYSIRSINKRFAITFAILLALAIAAIFWTRAHPMEFDHWPAASANSLIRLTAFAAASALLYIWSQKSRPEYFLLAILILAADGRFHLTNQNLTTPVATLKTLPPNASLPKLGQGRVFITPQAEDTFLRSRLKDPAQNFLGARLGAWSHLNLLDLVPKVNGSATLVSREQKELENWLYDKKNIEDPNHERWLDMLGVTFVTSPNSAVEWTNRSKAMPLVRLSTGTPSVKKFSEHEILIEIDTAQPATVSIAQNRYPAWKAELNGTSITNAPFTFANMGFAGWRPLAYEVPAGKSSLRIFYHDHQFILGAVISLLSLTACCALFRLAKSKS